MPAANSGVRAAKPTRALWYSVFQAIENERCLDLRFRATRTSLKDDDPVPNYKVMKQLVLKNKLGFFYSPFISLALVLIPILAMLHWLFAIFVSIAHAGRASEATLHIVPTTHGNTGLIDTALCADPAMNGRQQDRDILAFSRLCREVGLSGVLLCIESHILLLFRILRTDHRRRTDLLLHSRDAFVLFMLVCYAQRHPTHVFATDDHYQRWAFLLSHNCGNFRIVQHGFLDSNIVFAHSFGVVQSLYVCDPIFIPEFSAYYSILESRVFTQVTALTPNPFSEIGLLLASSFPSIDSEIELLIQIQARSEVPVIVKFHPSHSYDSRRQRLVALASYVCTDDENPMCKIFISHNSFMELAYKARGIPTFSIVRSGGPSEAAQAILALLEHAKP
jgi:hypothetical protein